MRKDAQTGTNIVVVKSAGTVDYVHGEVNLNTVNITETEKVNNIVRFRHSQNPMMS